jgi:hypothetical protein
MEFESREGGESDTLIVDAAGGEYSEGGMQANMLHVLCKPEVFS